MALELQISTQQAQRSLRQVEQSLGALEAALNRTGRNPAFEQFVSRLSAFKGVDPSAIASIQRLSQILSSVGRASGVAGLSRELSRLASVNTAKVAEGVMRLNQALRQLQPPPGLSKLANDLRTIEAAMRSAVPAARQLGDAVRGIRVSQGLSRLSQAINAGKTELLSATIAANGLGGALRSVSGIAAGFGVALGGVGIARFISGSFDALNVTQRFSATMETVTGSASLAAEQLEFVRQTAKGTATDFNTLANSYARFAAGAATSNFTLDETQQLFTQIATASRVLNVSTADTEGIFRAMIQIMSKGTVMSEELRLQIGDRLPGAMNLFAKSMGVSTAELLKLMETGQVSARSLIGFGNLLQEEYGGGLPRALQTAAASVTNLGNAFTFVQQAFGEQFFGQLQSGIEALTAAISTDAFKSFAADIGFIAGTLANALAQAIAFTINHWEALKYAILGVIGLQVGAMINGWVSPFLAGASAAMQLASALGVSRTAFIGMAIGSTIMTTLTGVVTTLTTALRAFWAALGPIGLAITALTVAVPLLISAYNGWTNSASQAATSTNDAAHAASQASDAIAESSKQAQTASSSFSRFAQSIWDVVRAFIAMLAAQSDVNGPSSGGSSVDADAFARGGIVGVTRAPSVTLPAAAFVNAPRLAAGISNTSAFAGGGFPAVLHPNEAVIPLANGAVPVSLSMSASGGVSIVRDDQAYAMLRKIDQGAAEIRESVIDVGVVIKNEFDRLYACANASKVILGQMLTKLSVSAPSPTMPMPMPLPSLPSTAETPMGESSKYGGGAGLDQATINELMKQGGKWVFYGGFGSQPSIYGAGRFMTGPAGRAKMGSPNLYKDVMGYADGSPNAMRDMMMPDGGFQAILHPDEAVIPLPDGRSVPVTFPDAPSRGGPSASSGNTYNVYMTVNAKDADSFRLSKTQILRELQSELRHADRTLGPAPDKVDDPTRREV